MGLLEKWSSPLDIHRSYYYVSYTSLRESADGGDADLNDNTLCLLQFRLNDWSDSMRIAFFALFWNLPLILWLLPWKTQYPTLNTSLQALFQSPDYGLSLQHWKKIGKVTGARMKTLAGSLPFESWVRVYIALIAASMVTKTLLFLSVAKPQSMENYKDLYQSEPLGEFINGQTILLSMLFIGDWFILMADAPSRLLKNVAIPQSTARLVSRMLNLQVLCTAMMLVYHWKIFSLCCVMALALMLTLRIVGMATLFFLPTAGSVGILFYALFRLLFEPIAQRRGHTYWNHRAREWTAAFVWLFVTWLAWSACFAIMLLFFNPRFDSVVCLDIASKPAMGTFFFQLSMVVLTVLMIYIFGVIDSVKWNFEKMSMNSVLYGFRCRNMKQFDQIAKDAAAARQSAQLEASQSVRTGQLSSQNRRGQPIVYASQASHVSKEINQREPLTSDPGSVSDGRLSQMSLDEELLTDEENERKGDSDNDEQSPLLSNRDATGAVV